MYLGLMFCLGLVAAVPVLISVLWLAARLGDMLPPDPAEAGMYPSQRSVPARGGPAEPRPVPPRTAPPRAA